MTQCPGCPADLERDTHSVVVRGARRGLLTSCCQIWLSEDLLYGLGIALSSEANSLDLVLIEP